MKTIYIVDTEDGMNLPAGFRAALPHCTFEGMARPEELGTPTHPHGRMCAWWAGIATYPTPTKIVFVRIFDKDGKAVWHDRWFFPQLAQLPPALTFHAAGNDDKNDADPDVDYPQSQRPTFMEIVGAHDRQGIPSVWSGDRAGAVQCMMWAQDIALFDGTQWAIGSGTSFACPKAAGLCAATLDVPVISNSWGAWDGDKADQEVDAAYWTTWCVEYAKAIRVEETAAAREEWRRIVRSQATRPAEFTPPHAKWGWGSMESAFQARLQQNVPTRLLPFHGTATSATLPKWRDFKLVET